MNSSQALNLIVKLAGFKLLARANRFGADSDLARDAHDTVMAILDGYRAELAELVHHAAEAARETGLDRKEDLVCHLLCLQDETDQFWYGCQPFEIGGWRRTEPDGSFTNPVSGNVEIIADDLLLVEIPPERLNGLPAILDDLAAECDIRFTYDMVLYRPKPRNPNPSEGIAPFDPDTDIPW